MRNLFVSRMIGTFFFGVLISSAASAQQVYKWVDATGNVNYSTVRPADRDARMLEADDSRLTVVPAPPKPTPRTLSAEEQMQRARNARIEDESTRARNANALTARADADRLQGWRERCERDRRVDCNDEHALIRDYGLWAPRVGVRPSPLVPGTQLIAPAPPPPSQRSRRAG
jgi:Domain of unknown function (DUF4124)